MTQLSFSRKKRKPVQADMAPLIDVVFLLLIFFMLTMSMVKESDLKVKLPTAKSGGSPKVEERYVVIDSNGVVFFDKKEVTSEDLKILLEEIENKEQSIRVKADKVVQIEKVVEVFDIAKVAGFKNVSIVTTR